MNATSDATPNTWIIGAPKCGTSSAFGWLAAHPAVVATLRKETYCLLDDGHPLARRRLPIPEDWRSPTWNREPASGRIRLEGTTHHLYQRRALDVIAAIPGSRVLVFLRDPAERVLSSFRFTKHTLGHIPPHIDFPTFLEAVERGDDLLETGLCRDEASARVLERDLDYSRYSRWLEPWLAALGPERLLGVLFEAVRENPRRELAAIARFLDLDPGFFTELDVGARNRTTSMRSQGLHRSLRGLAARFPVLRSDNPLRRIYRRLQEREAPATAREAEASRALGRRFEDEAPAVERLLGLPAPRWWTHDSSGRPAVRHGS